MENRNEFIKRIMQERPDLQNEYGIKYLSHKYDEQVFAIEHWEETIYILNSLRKENGEPLYEPNYDI